ncbi:integrase [Candidatus Poribacteria bacterium]|nr:integrase [Candidatus Poribacteria bacterium]
MEFLNHDLAQFAIVVTTGICAGFLNTVAGGGSLLTLPVLIFLGLDGATVANGTNRVAIMIQNTVGIAGFRRKGISDFRYGIFIAIPAMIGAVMGALLAINLGKFDKSGVIFNRLLAMIMIGVLTITLANPFKKFQSDVENLGILRKTLAALLFFFLGIYMGFIQAGVGFMIIATLTTVNGFDLVRTNALKMFVVLFCTFVALIIFVTNDHVNWGMGIALGGGNAVGAWVGSHWAVEKGDKWIRIILVVTVSAFAIKLIWTSLTQSIA